MNTVIKSFFNSAVTGGIANLQAATFLVEDLIPTDAVGMARGATASCKSVWAMHVACSVATGQDFCGKKVKQGKVAYIAAEGAKGFINRTAAWSQQFNAGRPMDDLQVFGQALMLTNREHTLAAIEGFKQSNWLPSLIVVDTLARCFEGEENSASDMNRFIQNCDLLVRELGCTVLIIHHTGKDVDKGARGSSALKAACDFEIAISRPSEYQVSVQNTKQKDSAECKPFVIDLEQVTVGTNTDGKDVTALIIKGVGTNVTKTGKPKQASKDSDIQSTIVDVLGKSQEGAVSTYDLNSAVKSLLPEVFAGMKADTSNKKIKRAKDSLINQGVVEFDSSTKTYKLIPYSLKGE